MEPTSLRGATTTAPWQRTPATLAGTLTVPPPNNAGTIQRTVSASGRRLPAVMVKTKYLILFLFKFDVDIIDKCTVKSAYKELFGTKNICSL